jgi:putative oxidoreductase
MLHGYPKLAAGTQMWTGLGGAMGNLGIHFAPAFWGFMAALSEFGGGLCLIAGVAFRIATAMMSFTMLVAVIMHLSKGDGVGGYSHALELLIVLVGLLVIGPGRFALASLVKTKALQ